MIKNGKIWPLGIGISFILVVALIIGTIKTSLEYPVEKSNDYMRDYHETDRNANELIRNKIAFDKNYNIDFVTDKIDTKATQIKFKITDKSGNIVDNAKLKVVLTRPDKREFDIELSDAKLENGIYSFNQVSLPKEGRWNIITEIIVDKFVRYFNVKADTRKTEFKIY